MAHLSIIPAQMQRNIEGQSKPSGLLAQTSHEHHKQISIQASKTWFALFLCLPITTVKSSSQDAFQVSSKNISSCFFPTDHKCGNFILSVSNRHHDIIFPLLLSTLVNLSSNKSDFPSQPGHGKSICHLAQVETGVELVKQGGCPKT